MTFGKFFGVSCSAVLLTILSSGCHQLEQRATEAAYQRSEQATERAERYPLCCESTADIHYHPVERQRLFADFAPGFSQMRLFPTGRSYFKGMDLGEEAHTRTIYFKIEMMDAARGQRATLMVPSVQFLDESFRLTRMPIEPPLCFYRGMRTEDVGYFARVNRIPESTRYMIVYADRTALNRAVPYSSSATTSAGGIPIDVSTQYNFPRSLEGAVQIWAGADRTLENTLDDHCQWH